MDWKEQMKMQYDAFKQTMSKNANISLQIWCIGFLDIVGRYSYHYLGWWSYGIRFIVYWLTLWMMLNEQSLMKVIKTGIIGLSLIAAGLCLYKQYEQMEEQVSKFSVSTFTVYVHLQILIAAVACLICCLNNVRRFLAYVYIFLLFGVIFDVFPRLICELFIMVSIFCYTLIFLHIFENGIVYSEDLDRFFEMCNLLMNICDRLSLRQTVEILSRVFTERLVFAWYFISMFVVSFIYYSTVLGREENQTLHSVLFSTVGSCSASFIGVLGWRTCFLVLTPKLLSACLATVKTDDNDPNFAPLLLRPIYLICLDIYFRDMDDYQRGDQFIQRLLCLLAETCCICFLVIQTASSRNEVLQGNLLTSTRVILMHILFMICPLLIARFLQLTYFFETFWILRAMALFCVVPVRAVASLLVFLLKKYDVHRDDIWEHFDDIVHNIRLTSVIVTIVIEILAGLYGLYAILMGHFYWEDVIRLVLLCHLSIYGTIVNLKMYLDHKRKIASLAEDLDDATEDQILENNDRCPICFQEMQKAKVTSCNHLFHRTCLQKWLLSKNVCPKCNTVVSKQKTN